MSALRVCVFLAVVLSVFGARLSWGAEPSPEVQSFVRYQAHPTLIRDVRVIDGTGAVARPGQDVLLVDGEIRYVGPTGNSIDPALFGGEDQEKDLVVIDASGKSLLPGYVMMHEHLMYTANANRHFFVTQQPISFPRLYLAAGVTTARTAGGVNVSQDLSIAHEINAGRLVGPFFDVTSPHMVGGLPDETDFPYGTIGLPNLIDAQGAVRFVDYWAGLGVTSFKAHTHVAQEVMQAGIEAAHAKGLKFTAHLCSLTYRESAELGLDNIEHGFFEMTDFVPGKQQDECPSSRNKLAGLSPDQPEVNELIEFLIARGVAVTSTLPVMVRAHKTLGELPREALAVLDAPTRSAFLQRRAQALARPEALIQAEEKNLRVGMALIRRFHDQGGHLLVGTDPTGMGGTIAGFANFEAIELLVEAGLSPLQAIKAATLNGAQYLEREAQIGSIEIGKQADLVLVSGAPDQHIRDVRRVELVFKQGVGFDAQKLFDSVQGTIGAPGG